MSVTDQLTPVQVASRETFLERYGKLLVSAVAIVLGLIAAHGRSTPYNNDTLLADALFHGRLWIDWPGDSTSDALLWNGQRYVIEGPVPALIMLPFVALFGVTANQTLVAIGLAGAAVAAMWDVVRRLGVVARDAVWLCAFFFAGTTLWWCAMLGDVWFIAHVAAVLFTTLALRELCHPTPRAWLVALYAAAACESRMSLVLALPIYAYLLTIGGLGTNARDLSWAQRFAMLRSMALTLAPVVAVVLWYNLARWGVWYDIGYTEFYHRDSWGQPTGSPFQIGYLPYEIYSFFLQPPVLSEYRQLAQWPIFKVDEHGVALTWSSPALALAFLARAPQRAVFALWLGIALIAVPSLLYYLDGWYQYGMRHALDFEPLMLVLMAYVARAGLPRWGTVLIAFSVAMSIWGVWYWDTYFRTGN